MAIKNLRSAALLVLILALSTGAAREGRGRPDLSTDSHESTGRLGTEAVSREAPDLAAFVDPFIGTDGHGHTYPGATLPFGMVQLSPDTRLTGWDGCSGYHYSDSLVYGFSHTHLSGTGASDYGDILFMPTTGAVILERGGPEDSSSGYASRFRHERETASPGFYSVLLDDYGILVELTATKRIGLHRYIFPASESSNVIIDLTHRDRVLESSIRFLSDKEIEGYRRSSAWAEDQRIYFVARFSKPFRSFGISKGGVMLQGAREASGDDIKAFTSYGTESGEEVTVEVALSAVSCEGARRNLEAESQGGDFERARHAARDEWNRALGRIRIEGATDGQRTIFYTALYHAMLAPNLFMDVDGTYLGRDLEAHAAYGFDYYTVFSLWDTYRAEHPLFTIIERERTIDFIRTFLAQYEQGGLLPVWELAANETYCMIGYHAVPVIADAYIKGIRGYDARAALEAMKASAMADRFGLDHYRKLGYIPSEGEGESVSKTLEYAYDDWCIAQVAGELGLEDDYLYFIQRAQSYRNLYDPSTGFMRARFNGGWYEPFDPYEVNFNYTEANAWQYTFYVPQDLEGLIELMGGIEEFDRRLDSLFTARTELTGRGQPDITGLIGQYAHGNEPSQHMAYLYSYAGRPWKTQAAVRRIMDGLYGAGPAGLCGNEDCGQMSAWYVLSALGFYPVTPGSDIYVMGTPLFPRAEIDLGDGRRFVVEAGDVSSENIYIRSASLNGEPYTKSYLKHGDIMRGGTLRFEMSPEPSTEWGTGKGDIPKSSIDDFPVLAVPFVAEGARTFVDSTRVELATVDRDARIYYTLDGTEPGIDSPLYTGPFTARERSVLEAIAFREGMPASNMLTARFDRIPEGRSIILHAEYSPMYTAGGDMALIDMLRGAEDFRTGAWQGYQGVGLDAVVDLGSERPIDRVAAGFLQDQNSWIFMPMEVEFALSADGDRFDVVGVVPNDVPPEADGPIVKDFSKEGVNRTARYVRVRARNIGLCPDWHKGAGHKAWIFSDEIVIE
jgi:predicted alpha-1,2-mannosidase